VLQLAQAGQRRQQSALHIDPAAGNGQRSSTDRRRLGRARGGCTSAVTRMSRRRGYRNRAGR
jgi:hypothetical protein